jgi:hypothetical protein
MPQGYGIETLTPIRLAAGDKLLLLRRIDHLSGWESLDDKRYCRRCGTVFTGRQIDVVGGTRGLGPLRLLCPTEGCRANFSDWVRTPRKLHSERARAASVESS